VFFHNKWLVFVSWFLWILHWLQGSYYVNMQLRHWISALQQVLTCKKNLVLFLLMLFYFVF
jgi:hypothetical protein